MSLRERFWKLWLLLSQALNALAYAGDPDESLSARRWREGKPEGIDHWLGQGHCKSVWQEQKAREMRRNLFKERQ